MALLLPTRGACACVGPSSRPAVAPACAAASATAARPAPVAGGATGGPAPTGFVGRRVTLRGRPTPVRAAGGDAAATDAPPAKETSPIPKGSFVRVDKAAYETSLEAQANQPVGYTGLGYIFEDRGEVLETRKFSTGWYALIAWSGVPTPPAWLRCDYLVKSKKNSYQRT